MTGMSLASSAQGQFVEGTYTDADGTLSYRLYRPAVVSAKPPLFVMLHGASQSAADFAAGTRMNEVASEHGGLVLYPEQSIGANFFGCWNWFDSRHQSADEGEPSMIAGLTRQVIAEQGVDASRVYVAGMSAGGAMAVILGQAFPNLYAAVGVHSGLPAGAATDLVSGLSTMRCGPPADLDQQAPRPSVATIVFHGDCDATVHVSNGEAVHLQSIGQRDAAAVSNAVCDPGRRTATRTTQRRRNGAPAAELWIVHGAGHAWTGGDPSATFTDPDGPDASREMTRFFLQQQLPRLQARA